MLQCRGDGRSLKIALRSGAICGTRLQGLSTNNPLEALCISCSLCTKQIYIPLRKGRTNDRCRCFEISYGDDDCTTEMQPCSCLSLLSSKPIQLPTIVCILILITTTTATSISKSMSISTQSFSFINIHYDPARPGTSSSLPNKPPDSVARSIPSIKRRLSTESKEWSSWCSMETFPTWRCTKSSLSLMYHWWSHMITMCFDCF